MLGLEPATARGRRLAGPRTGSYNPSSVAVAWNSGPFRTGPAAGNVGPEVRQVDHLTADTGIGWACGLPATIGQAIMDGVWVGDGRRYAAAWFWFMLRSYIERHHRGKVFGSALI